MLDNSESGVSDSNAVGIALGRFQPLHLKHLEYLLAAAEHCDHLVVGITNPDRGHIVESLSDPHRSLPESNPYSYYERYVMIRDSLAEAGLSRDRFDIVPAALGTATLLETMPSPKKAVVLVTIYDAWGHERRELLGRLGYEVKTLWERHASQKGITGTEVRRAIVSGEPWHQLVPDAVARLIDGLEPPFGGGPVISSAV